MVLDRLKGVVEAHGAALAYLRSLPATDSAAVAAALGEARLYDLPRAAETYAEATREGFILAGAVPEAVRVGRVDPTLFSGLDVTTVEGGGGVRFIQTAEGGWITLTELAKRVEEAADRLALPPLPFPSVFIGYDGGLRLSRAESAMRVGAAALCDFPTNMVPTRSLGFLLTRDLWGAGSAVLEFITDGATLQILPYYLHGTGWVAPCGHPWWIYAILHTLAKRECLREEKATLSFAQRRIRDRMKRGGMALPPPRPYYTVRLDPIEVRDVVARLHPPDDDPYPWSHRWDVAAHTRLLVRRGPVPLIGKRALVARGYTVYEPGDQVSPSDRADLERKGHALPQPGEWLAVRQVRVREHVRGPEDKPYVPSMRVLR